MYDSMKCSRLSAISYNSTKSEGAMRKSGLRLICLRH